MGGRLEVVLSYLERTEGPISYLVLGAAAALEYVVPPIPGDTITLFGTFLAATAGYSGALVYLTLTTGSVIGGLTAYGFGRYVGNHEARWPRFLRGPRTSRAIHGTIERFQRHGSAYLAINRFIPAFRGVFFVAAGMAEMHIVKVAFFGGLSALLWNGLILALGYSMGSNWEELLSLSRKYTWAFIAAVGLAVIAYGARRAVLRARKKRVDRAL